MIKKLICTVAAVLLCSLNVHAAEPIAQPSLTIITPSDSETMIASGRSFYINGTLSNYTYAAGDKMTVQLLNSTGTAVRTVSTDVYANPDLYVDKNSGMPNYFVDDAEFTPSGMPDLVTDTPGVFSNKGAIKCYFDGQQFNALIAGGSVPEGMTDVMNLVDENGNSYTPLSDGSYQVTVAISNDTTGTVVAEAKKTITIGNTPNKILARFSPDSHFDSVNAFAQATGYRVYLDPFPGYWSPDDNPFCEIAPEWRAADALEYTAGTVHFIIYNVKPSSTTYSVELGQLQHMGDIENPNRLVNYYYTTGEPTPINGVNSQIQAFDAGDKLQMTRAEINAQTAEDGIYNQDNAKAGEYDFDLSDGIQADVGETISLYGVTAPIQIDDADIVFNGDNTYTLNNKIKTIKYQLTADNTNETIEKTVTLNRLSNGWDNPSELEFKHSLTITKAMAGKDINVRAEGYDAHGTLVPGTEEIFVISVDGTESPEPPEPTPDPTPNPGGASGGNPDKNASAPIHKAAQTGDTAATTLYLLIMLLSLAGITAAYKSVLPHQ